LGVNNNKPDLWKADIAQSIDMYNDWFMGFAPTTFRETRIKTTEAVVTTLKITNNLTDISSAILRSHPGVLPTLRMSTCPPIAVDRLIGLAGVSGNLVNCMEKGKIPLKINQTTLNADLIKIGGVIQRMADPDIFIWLSREEPPTEVKLYRSATIVADRLCGAVANPIIRNAQEKRQLTKIKAWLEARGYQQLPVGDSTVFHSIPSGNFSFRMNVAVQQPNAQKTVNIPNRCGDYA